MEEPRCPHCQEPVAPTARACPHCRNATLADLRIARPVADSRTRYQIARALAALPAGLALSAAQVALSTPGGRLLQAALPGQVQPCVALLEKQGVAHTVEPSGASAQSVDEGGGARSATKVILALAAVIAVGFGVATLRKGPSTAAPTPSSPAAAKRLSGAELAQRALPSTVAIHCEDSIGTGFFVAPGRVLTNAHVVCAEGQPMVIRLSGGKEGSGQLVQKDDRLDLALVQVQGIDAPPLPLGDAGNLRVGDRVMVVGSPKGMEFSVTQGGVSNLDRIYLGVAMIQTDAPINPGNSGGPMLDEQGTVVGVVSLKRIDAEGISLALPVNYAFSGASPLLASPLGRESEAFRRMAARAEEDDRAQSAKLHETGQLPGLIGAVPGPGQVIGAQIAWPSAGDPGSQAFDFDLVRGTTRCSLRGEVSEWKKAEPREGQSGLDPRVKAWLDGHGFSSDVWVGIAVLRYAQCPDEALESGTVLEMHGADAGAAKVQF